MDITKHKNKQSWLNNLKKQSVEKSANAYANGVTTELQYKIRESLKEAFEAGYRMLETESDQEVVEWSRLCSRYKQALQKIALYHERHNEEYYPLTEIAREALDHENKKTQEPPEDEE